MVRGNARRRGLPRARHLHRRQHLDLWQPRLGLAFDPGGRGRWVLRASWGRFMHPATTSLAWGSWVERPVGVYLGLDFLCAVAELCDRSLARAVFGDDSELVHVDGDGDEHPYYLQHLESALGWDTVDTLGLGSLEAPHADTLTLGVEAQLLEPRGSRRGDDGWQLDLRLSEGFQLGRVHLQLIGTVVNAFSNEAAVAFRTDPLHPEGWGAPTSYQLPRTYEVGLRLEF